MIPTTVMGLQVHVSPDRPKLSVSADVPMTDAYRAHINAWLLDSFGVRNNLKDGQVFRTPAGLFMNPRTLATIKDAI